MPRYQLDAATMSSLIAYLKNLTSGPVPGVTRDVIHFATIITPDADPVARKGMLDVLERFFADKNAGYRSASPALRRAMGPRRLQLRCATRARTTRRSSGCAPRTGPRCRRPRNPGQPSLSRDSWASWRTRRSPLAGGRWRA